MLLNENFIFNASLSSGTEGCKNILIKGDNKKVLPDLLKFYSEKIKCIYIDPPYNNGDVYHFYNDKISHSEWVKDLHRTLQLLKAFLHKSGSIWISIDDKEMAYLKVEADKVFGRENFAGTIVWQQRKTRENRACFSNNHEYILVYAKDIKAFKKTRNLLSVDDSFVNSKYKNIDGDPRGPWQSITASVQAGHGVKSQFYTIVAPNGTKHNPPKGRCWVYNKERMAREIQQNNIWFGKNGKNVPRIKKFLSTAKIGLTPETLWMGEDVGTTDTAKKQLLEIFKREEKIFDTPKPEELIKRIVDISTKEGDYVLDCFLGSGTTIAVAHKMKRNYVGIEIGNQISDLVVKRLNMVVNGESGGVSPQVGWHGGGEFVFYDYKSQLSSRVEKVPERITLLHKPSSQISFVNELREKKAKYNARGKVNKRKK
ncbi:MAG: site-specific DNA-methyltransferase [archaeon]|nr:site-specific DNA-methyltransferase [archaeon]